MKKRVRTAKRVVITPEQRYHMVNDAAHFRSGKPGDRKGKPEDPAENWAKAQSDIDKVLKKHHTRS